MKIKKLSLLILLNTLLTMPAMAYNAWQRMEGTVAPAKGEQVLTPSKYTLFAANETTLLSVLSNLTDNPDAGQIVALPMPDGSFKDFIVWKNHTMADGLSKKYTGIQTFTATAKDNPRISAKLDWTLKGFHAMIFDGQHTSFVDPYSNQRSSYYIAYYRSDYSRPANALMSCLSGGNEDKYADLNIADGQDITTAKTINGSILRTYRLALACTVEYANAVGGATPTKASVLSAMVTSINRVNGVYERELAVSMQLIPNTDTLIFLDTLSDPYTNSDGAVMLAQNQTTVTNYIGGANYDLGHVFSTGGGGIAYLGSICRTSNKAGGVTGSPSPVGDSYDIDYVAHEMGHQLGAEHPFNNNASGSCSGNAAQTSAYEPGSGSTIMAYAGICSPDNIQTHSDAYFHARSLAAIVTNISGNQVASCPVITISNNKSVSLPAFTATYNIPYKTPFEITAPAAVDSVANDELTYCWEQWNLGDFGARFTNTRLRGPIFRSFEPDTSRTRVFPIITKLLVNSTSYLGEKLPDTTRFLTFKLTTRAILNGVGTVTIPDDTIHLNVIMTGTPFAVLTPNLSSVAWTGGTTQTVTWEPGGTTAAPISCATVDIYLSVDGGYTYPYLVKSAATNTGTADIAVPNMYTTSLARIKVKGTGNVFFDISNANFTINRGAGVVTGIGTTGALSQVAVYPVPATNELYISTGTKTVQAALLNLSGQVIWHGTVNGQTTIPVGQLARSIYYLRLQDNTSGEVNTRKVTLQ